MISKIAELVVKVLDVVGDIFRKTNEKATVIAPQLREFVVTTSNTLEEWIPDSGFGSTKLAAFDGALKIFIDELEKSGEIKREDFSGVWQLAHVFLEGYLAAEKAKQSFDK